jgi:ABC-type Mn2+/Zn2+ transport system ATPase subunit
VLSGLTFELLEGDRLGLVGPNGGGKTTLLRLLLGLLAPRSGQIVRSVPGLRFGYVPQRDTLDTVWPLVARDVVAMAAVRPGTRRSHAKRRAIACRALEALGEESLARVPFGRLSGGQQQRVLIARALASQPDVLVLDEPTNGLDLATATGLLELVGRLHADHGVTVVLATHDLNTVANHADRIGLVVDGGLTLGPVADMLTGPKLSQVYGVPVTVQQVNGQRVVLGGTEV